MFSMNSFPLLIQVYSDKLLFSVKPSTVRKFRQLYGVSSSENLSYIQLSETSSTTIDLLHSSLDVLNQHGSTYLTNYINSSSSQNVIPPNNGYQHLRTSVEKEEQLDSSNILTLAAETKPEVANNELKKASKNKVKKENRNMVRGRYVQYSDELRAKIGSFALKHGNSAAMKYSVSKKPHSSGILS